MNKKQSRGSKYVLFERKLMRKILSLVLVAICAVILLRELIRGRFGNTVVGFLTGLFRLDYDARCFRTFCAEIPGSSARNRIRCDFCASRSALLKTK